MYRAFKFRLYPTAEQDAQLRHFVGVTRLVYNLAWEQRRDFHRQYRRKNGRSISWPSQSREVTDLRREFDWIATVPRCAVTTALRDLDTAYSNFFAGRARYPTPRRKGENDSLRLPGSEIGIKWLNAKWAAIRIPNLGWVKFRITRVMAGKFKNVTVSLSAGSWHASFAYEIQSVAVPSNLPSVGIDRGVATSLAFSTGELLFLPDMTALERRHRRAQRIVSRRRRGSKRRLHALRAASRLKAKQARIRRHWHHVSALHIAQRFGAVVLEALNTKGMTAAGRGKRGLNRAILNQGWYSFETILAYKLEERGGTLVKINPAYTSQTCSSCGVIDKESRESQASFVCQHCGFAAHADHNAAINILRRNTPSMRAEGTGYGPDETRTIPNHVASLAA